MPFIAKKEEKKEILKEQPKLVKNKEREEMKSKFPPIDLLESDKGIPSSGDIKVNSAVIKKTLENFDIPVEMSEVKIGPTVTQYALKPAEGIKLSKITSLSDDLSLALAARSIRIEAPIPGRSLVGIEIPNRIRAEVRLRNLMRTLTIVTRRHTFLLLWVRMSQVSQIILVLRRCPIY